MEWNALSAQNLAIIDQEVEDHSLSPAAYEIARRIVFYTFDFGYLSSLAFSPASLQTGAAALAARTTIVVDVPMVKAGILPNVDKYFANPIYCGMETLTRPQKQKTKTAWGIQTLARRYPEAIFIIGEDLSALKVLIDLAESDQIKPALVIATPGGFVGAELLKNKLKNSTLPHIRVDGNKGGAVVAVAIFTALIDLAWQAYQQDTKVVNN